MERLGKNIKYIMICLKSRLGIFIGRSRVSVYGFEVLVEYFFTLQLYWVSL